LERAANQPRDVHLRDADLRRDLRLRQPLEEAEVQDPPLPVVEHAKARLEHGAVLGHFVHVLLAADRLERVEVALLVADRPGRQGHGAVRASALERLEHLLLLHPGFLGDLGDRGRAAELHGQLLDEAGQLDGELLEPARHAHRPALVAGVPRDPAYDVRRRVGRQLDAAVEVEAVDRLDQADGADLDEVVELLAAVGVAPGERADERHVLLDQLVPGGEVSLLVVAAQERGVVGIRHQAGRALVSRTQSPSSRVSTAWASTVESSTRRTPSSRSPAGARSWRRALPSKGPRRASMRPSSSSISSVTCPSPRSRWSTSSTASWRSSSASSVKFSRMATPPSTRCATPKK